MFENGVAVHIYIFESDGRLGIDNLKRHESAFHYGKVEFDGFA